MTLRVWITGASSGLGAALARYYDAQGATLGLVARREAPLRILAAQLKSSPYIYPLDVTDGQNGQKAYLTVTVNTAGKTNTELITIVSSHAGTSHYVNELNVDPADVSFQTGHTDGGRLIRTLYGHPEEKRARDRMQEAFRQRMKYPTTR